MQTAESRAFWIVRPGHGEIRTEPLSPTGEADVVVRALYSGISRGTESLVFRGLVPPSEYDRMRAPFQSGSFPAPIKYGYSSVGMVEQGPQELVGRHVFALYPHQTRYVVPAAAVSALPEDVPPRRAILAANLETALNAIWDARLLPGDRVAVVGAGTVGCCIARLAAGIPGCDVELIDVNHAREREARAVGVRFAAPARASHDADVVFHASGSPQGLVTACSLAGFEALVVELSWYGTQIVPLPLGEAFHARRLTIKSSQVGTVAAAQRARWDFRRRMGLAVSLLRDPALDCLISDESAFEMLPETMRLIAEGRDSGLCHRIVYV